MTPSIPPLPGRDRQSRLRRLARHPLQIGQAAARPAGNANFRLELFHLGHLYKRPVVVNVLRDGIPAPIPYAANLFDYGHNKIEGEPADQSRLRRLPPPLSAQRARTSWDEVVAFLGASYFRFLGRGQRYGLSARGLAIGAGRRAQRGVSVLPRILDRHARIRPPITSSSMRCSTANRRPAPSASTSCPAQETCIDATVNLFARRPFARARAWRRFPRCSSSARTIIASTDDFRSELHDSDGLLIHTGAGEWIWRPLSNPAAPAVSAFLDNNRARLRAPAARPQLRTLSGPRSRL